MTHLQKAPRKPLLNVKQGEVFVECLEDDLHKKIAKDIFVGGMTNEEIAEKYFYCKRQVERLRVDLTKNVLKKLIEKQIPKKPKYIEGDYDMPLCPCCGMSVDENEENYCSVCGQALDWGDGE